MQGYDPIALSSETDGKGIGMSPTTENPTFQALLAQFNGAHVVKINQAGAAIGLKPQSSYNAVQKKTFPLPVVAVGPRHGVRVLDIANYLDGLTPARRRGRPSRKEESAEAKQRGTVKEFRAQHSIPKGVSPDLETPAKESTK